MPGATRRTSSSHFHGRGADPVPFGRAATLLAWHRLPPTPGDESRPQPPSMNTGCFHRNARRRDPARGAGRRSAGMMRPDRNARIGAREDNDLFTQTCQSCLVGRFGFPPGGNFLPVGLAAPSKGAAFLHLSPPCRRGFSRLTRVTIRHSVLGQKSASPTGSIKTILKRAGSPALFIYGAPPGRCATFAGRSCAPPASRFSDRRKMRA